MSSHLEFVVTGPPISNQQSSPEGRSVLLSWRGAIAGAVRPIWGSRAALKSELKAVIINFFAGSRPSVDLDNMSKPILDEMQNVVYENDRQIRQAEIAHVNIGAAFRIQGASKVVVDAIHAGDGFVFVRIEDPLDPFPLPR